MSTTSDLRASYLDLLRNYLTRYGEDELSTIRASNRPIVRLVLKALAKRNINVVRRVPFDETKRNLGLTGLPPLRR